MQGGREVAEEAGQRRREAGRLPDDDGGEDVGHAAALRGPEKGG